MKWTTAKKAKFLAALAERPNVSRAARLIGCSRSYAYTRREADPKFAAAWDEAIEAATDDLEEEARRRALEGDEEYVVSHGVVVTYNGEPVKVRKRSDVLLCKLLEAYRPEKYRRNFDGQLSGTIKIVIDEQDAGL